MTTVGDEDVGRLDVAMDDAFAVCRIKPVGDVDSDGKKRFRFDLRCLLEDDDT